MEVLTNYTAFEQIVLNNIDLESYDIEAKTNFDKMQETYNIFLSEYGFNVRRMGELKAFTEYLKGLPTVLTVPFYNYDILNIASLYDLISANATEEQEDEFLSTYFENVAMAFFTLKNNL